MYPITPYAAATSGRPHFRIAATPSSGSCSLTWGEETGLVSQRKDAVGQGGCNFLCLSLSEKYVNSRLQKCEFGKAWKRQRLIHD